MFCLYQLNGNSIPSFTVLIAFAFFLNLHKKMFGVHYDSSSILQILLNFALISVTKHISENF